MLAASGNSPENIVRRAEFYPVPRTGSFPECRAAQQERGRDLRWAGADRRAPDRERAGHDVDGPGLDHPAPR
jgi:hypothetical protein